MSKNLHFFKLKEGCDREIARDSGLVSEIWNSTENDGKILIHPQQKST